MFKTTYVLSLLYGIEKTQTHTRTHAHKHTSQWIFVWMLNLMMEFFHWPCMYRYVSTCCQTIYVFNIYFINSKQCYFVVSKKEEEWGWWILLLFFIEWRVYNAVMLLFTNWRLYPLLCPCYYIWRCIAVKMDCIPSCVHAIILEGA